MIKLTHVPSSVADAPALFLVPGGPGLSSDTLRSLDLLARSFHLYYVDMPGTAGVPFAQGLSIAGLAEELAGEMAKVGRRGFVLGHSFGGFFAAEAALRAGRTAAGLICLATPFSNESQDAAGVRYGAARGPELQAAEARWEKNPSEDSFREWLSECGKVYFADSNLAAGSEMLMGDRCSYEQYLALRPEARKIGDLLDRIKRWNGAKLFVAGAVDGILPAGSLKKDADAGGFSFAAVPNASHFVMFDQPEAVAGVIEKFCATGGRTL